MNSAVEAHASDQEMDYRKAAREEELAKFAEIQAKKNKRFGARGDRSGIVLIKEKAIISDSFCVGGYSFGSADDFLYAANTCRECLQPTGSNKIVYKDGSFGSPIKMPAVPETSPPLRSEVDFLLEKELFGDNSQALSLAQAGDVGPRLECRR